MKKLIITALTVVMCIVFVGCGETGTDEGSDASLGIPVELGAYTFYTESWRHVADEDTKSEDAYTATLLFDGNEAPFEITDSNWKDLPQFSMEVEGRKTISMQSVSTSAAEDSIDHEGKMEFLFLLPKDSKLPKKAVLIDKASGDSAELDLRYMKLVEE